MRSTRRTIALRLAVVAGIATSAVALSATAIATTTPHAADRVVYRATLAPVNGSGAQGSVQISLSGNHATIAEHVTGLAASFDGSPYPHVQHIHIKGTGNCPTLSADTNGDGLINTKEGIPYYGSIGTSLTTSGDTRPSAGTALNVAPQGASFDYERTIDLDPDTLASLRAGTADVVIHGLDPRTISHTAQGEQSELVPSLPLAATSPALCGFLTPGAWAAAPGSTVPPSMDPAAAMSARPTYTG